MKGDHNRHHFEGQTTGTLTVLSTVAEQLALPAWFKPAAKV